MLHNDWMELQGLLIPLLWIVFLGGAIVSGAIGLILAYHWARFSANPAIAFVTIATYAAGCILLLGIMFAALLAL